MNCEYLRDVYPDVLRGAAAAELVQQVRAHLVSCDECRAEAELLAHIAATPVAVPAGLHERVVTALRVPQPRWRPSRSGLAMAATLAAAVIGGSLLLDMPSERRAEPGFGFVSVEDAMISGATSLDDLSVEELEKLLGEMGS